MPASAEKALQGMLAEGTEASSVLKALRSSGFEITPPAGDDTYGDEPPEGAMGIEVMLAGPVEPPGEESEMAPPSDKEDEKDTPDKKGGDQKPVSMFKRREKAAKAAMKKHGYPTESDEDEDKD